MEQKKKYIAEKYKHRFQPGPTHIGSSRTDGWWLHFVV